MAHFFAFLLAIWGELSPPTSLTAAVASRIAESSFMRTMYEALVVAPAVIFGITRHRLIAGPASSLAPQPAK